MADERLTRGGRRGLRREGAAPEQRTLRASRPQAARRGHAWSRGAQGDGGERWGTARDFALKDRNWVAMEAGNGIKRDLFWKMREGLFADRGDLANPSESAERGRGFPVTSG